MGGAGAFSISTSDADRRGASGIGAKEQRLQCRAQARVRLNSGTSLALLRKRDFKRWSVWKLENPKLT